MLRLPFWAAIIAIGTLLTIAVPATAGQPPSPGDTLPAAVPAHAAAHAHAFGGDPVGYVVELASETVGPPEDPCRPYCLE